MPPDKRRAPPGGSGASSSEHSACNQQLPEHTRPARRRSRRPPSLIPIGPVAAEIVANLKFRRQVERVHALGPRAVAEPLAEIGAERGITTIVDQKLTTYAWFDPAAIEATGGDTFWPAPLRVVRP